MSADVTAVSLSMLRVGRPVATAVPLLADCLSRVQPLIGPSLTPMISGDGVEGASIGDSASDTGSDTGTPLPTPLPVQLSRLQEKQLSRQVRHGLEEETASLTAALRGAMPSPPTLQLEASALPRETASRYL